MSKALAKQSNIFVQDSAGAACLAVWMASHFGYIYVNVSFL